MLQELHYYYTLRRPNRAPPLLTRAHLARIPTLPPPSTATRTPLRATPKPARARARSSPHTHTCSELAYIHAHTYTSFSYIQRTRRRALPSRRRQISRPCLTPRTHKHRRELARAHHIPRPYVYIYCIHAYIYRYIALTPPPHRRRANYTLRKFMGTV